MNKNNQRYTVRIMDYSVFTTDEKQQEKYYPTYEYDNDIFIYDNQETDTVYQVKSKIPLKTDEIYLYDHDLLQDTDWDEQKYSTKEVSVLKFLDENKEELDKEIDSYTDQRNVYIKQDIRFNLSENATPKKQQWLKDSMEYDVLWTDFPFDSFDKAVGFAIDCKTQWIDRAKRLEVEKEKKSKDKGFTR